MQDAKHPNASHASDSSSPLSRADEEDLAFDLAEAVLHKLRTGHPVDVRAVCASHPNISERVYDLVRQGAALEGLNPSVAARVAGDAPIAPTILSPQVDHQPHAVDQARPSISGYTDLEPTGQGALGVVYKAIQLGTNRTVAIKLMRPELEWNQKARQLFIREASISSRLKHPKIVECLGFGFSGTRPYLVMEFVKSESLEELARKHKPARRVRLAVKIVMHILEALMYAHNNGVVHRDIKLSNILAYRAKDKLWLKVADFGLAKMYETAGYSGITGSRELCGTLAYMPPEQLLDSRSAEPQVDVYASAVCLFRLLTGEYPYPELSFSESFRRRLSDEARPVQSLNSHVPDALAKILHQALLRDASIRMKSAEVFHQALRTLPLLQKE